MMERLTRRTDGVVVYVGAHNEEAGGQIPCEVGPQGVREILARLAEYEDAGLSPAACEEARKIEEGLSVYGYSVARMVELMIADKEGRVVVRGRWDDSGRYTFPSGSTAVRCSECGCALTISEYRLNNWNYCPVCGAKMDGAKHDQD